MDRERRTVICPTFRRAALALVLVSVAAPRPAAAQMGALGGLGLASLFGDNVQQADTRTGLTLGAHISLLNLGPISIGPEIYYAQKGARTTRINGQGAYAFEEFALDYLEVPVLARLRLPLGPAMRGYVQGGPAFGWRLNCRLAVAEGAGVRVADDCDLGQFGDARTAIDSADRGIVVGGGLSVRLLGLGSLNLDARMVQGLARLTGGSDGPDVRNRAFSFMVGYSGR